MQYDLIVIGAGWAGFNAALRAKELGLKVAIVEKNKLGGTCLNLGCIPTKALLQSAKIYSLSKKAKSFGIDIQSPALDFAQMQKRKAQVTEQLRSGISFMLKGVDILNAEAELLSSDTIKAGSEELRSRFILIASGSRPQVPKALKEINPGLMTSDQILEIQSLPKSLLIIGGGVIGSEFASLFNALGTDVSLVELMPQLLPGQDKEVAKKLENIFKKKGIRVSTNTDALAVSHSGYEASLCCIGRSPNSAGLGLEKLGLKTESGRIVTDQTLRTNIPNIYAAGDCTGRAMLAHAASYQGILAVENMLNPGSPREADGVLPSCIFSDPEISSVGMTEERAGTATHKFDLLGSGMARILDETEGFIKVISDKETAVILGASIIGPRATELIGTLTVAVKNKLTVANLKATIFAHPTISEIIPEALRR